MENGSPRMEVPALTDETVVERIVSGDTDLFEILLRRHNQRIYRVVRSIMGDDMASEDAMQEAYVRAFTRLRTFDGTGPFVAWLTRIAVNEALKMRNARSRRLDNDPAIESWGDGARVPIIESEERDVSLRALIEDSIDELSPALRAVFVLRQVEQLSVRETAASLDISTASVKTSLHRARKQLQDSIERRLGDELTDVFSFAGARCDRMVHSVLVRLSE